MAISTQATSSSKVHWSNEIVHVLELYYDKYIHCACGNLKNDHWNEIASNISGKLGLTITKKNCKSKYDSLWKKHKKEPEELVKTSTRTSSFWEWYEQCAILWGCTLKVASMPGAMDNGIQVLYTWQTIDLEKYEQDRLEKQDSLFDLNEDFEEVNPQRGFWGLIQALKLKKLLDLNPL